MTNLPNFGQIINKMYCGLYLGLSHASTESKGGRKTARIIEYKGYKSEYYQEFN